MLHPVCSVWRVFFVFILSILLVPYSFSMPSLDNDFKINNNAANCSISQGDILSFQYNEIPASMVNKSHVTPLQSTSSRVSVICNIPTLIFLQFNGRGNVFSTTNEQSYYSLGRVNRNGTLGYFSVSLSNPVIDGKRGMLLRTGNKSNIDKIGKNLPIHSNYYYAVSVNDKLTRSTTISFDLLVHPYLNKITDTNGPLIDGGQLDGNVELLISYGN